MHKFAYLCASFGKHNFMKRINEYKKLLNVEGEINLRELKRSYRTLIKEWHPDKVRDESKREEAETNSLKIIDGYHFLVSIAPETKVAKLEEYQTTLKESKIADYDHKSMLMKVTFTDGVTYEYFGVNKNLFNKFHKAANQANFARRNIFNSFIYRKASKGTEKE